MVKRHARFGHRTLPGAVVLLALTALQAAAVLAAPSFTTSAEIFGYSSGEIKGVFAGPTVDESLSTGATDTYSFFGRAYGNGAVLNPAGGSVSYALGALSEMNAMQVGFTSPYRTTASVTAAVTLSDSLTFSAPLPANALVTVRLTYFLSPVGCGNCIILPPPIPGVRPNTNQGNVRSWVYDYDFVNSRLLYSDEQLATFRVLGGSTNTGGSFVHEMVVQNGHTYSYDLALTTQILSARADAIAQGFDTNPGYFDVYGKADYSTTLVIAGIEAFDSGGNPLTQFLVTNSNGLTLTPVPEPAIYGMLTFGLVVICWAARTRGRLSA